MRVHLIKKQSIEDFFEKHSNSRNSFHLWLNALKIARWQQPKDIKITFGATDFLGKGCNRVVFDIAGNNYRMICKYLFGKHEVHLFVCWIGSHAEYDKICKLNQQYTINVFND